MLLSRQLTEDRVVDLALARTPFVLHEHEVPELEVPIAVRLLAAGDVVLGAVLGATVDQDLRAGTARARHAHRPEVRALAEPDHPGLGQADLVPPQVVRLVVVDVDRGPQARLVQPVATVGLRLGDQLPGELDRALLEVVTEGEVAVHLEERAVPGGLAHLVDVRGADALLDAGGARIRRRHLAQQVRLERHHAGVHEQQVRIVGDQARARHHGMTVAGEVIEETLADLCSLHGFIRCLAGSVRGTGSGGHRGSGGLPRSSRCPESGHDTADVDRAARLIAAHCDLTTRHAETPPHIPLSTPAAEPDGAGTTAALPGPGSPTSGRLWACHDLTARYDGQSSQFEPAVDNPSWATTRAGLS